MDFFTAIRDDFFSDKAITASFPTFRNSYFFLTKRGLSSVFYLLGLQIFFVQIE